VKAAEQGESFDKGQAEPETQDIVMLDQEQTGGTAEPAQTDAPAPTNDKSSKHSSMTTQAWLMSCSGSSREPRRRRRMEMKALESRHRKGKEGKGNETRKSKGGTMGGERRRRPEVHEHDKG
jgi:hypothetical protein